MIQDIIEMKLKNVFSPEYLEVINESYMHHVPEGSESHFKVIIVSSAFKNKQLIQRHRSINMTLADELAGKIHALTMYTYTPTEWDSLPESGVRKSPDCLGIGQ